jgi:primosomal protein N''
MKTLTDIVAEQHAARAPHDDPLTDRLMAQIVALAEEVCVLRDRLDTVERIVDSGQVADATAIDAWQPPQEVIEARLARHKAWFEEVFAELSGVNERL